MKNRFKENKIIELIQSKIEELENRINTTENEQIIKEYCIRRLELIWLLDDVKELIENERIN